MTYKIIIAPTALKMLKGIADRRVRDLIVRRIDDLIKNRRSRGNRLLRNYPATEASELQGNVTGLSIAWLMIKSWFISLRSGSARKEAARIFTILQRNLSASGFSTLMNNLTTR